MKTLIKNTLLFVLITATVFGVGSVVHAQFNKEINYQGKLADSAGSTIADGDYDITFRLYTASSGGSAIWTETRAASGGDGPAVSVTSGLFSVRLGRYSSLDSVDFNQDLWLSVEVEGDGEMTPRKKLTSVPHAFEAENAQSLSGLASSSFFRSDTADDVEATSSETLVEVIQNGAGNVFKAMGAAVGLVVDNDGQVGVGTSTPNEQLTVDGSSTITGSLTVNGGDVLSSGPLDISSGSSSELSLNTDALTVDSNGNVGIGTSSPVSALSVAGTTTADALSVNGDEITDFTGNNLSVTDGVLNASGGGGGSSASSSGAVQFSDGSGGFLADGDNFFWDNTSTRLGIGTSTPNNVFHVNKSTDSFVNILATNHFDGSSSGMSYVTEAADSSGHFGASGQSYSGSNALFQNDSVFLSAEPESSNGLGLAARASAPIRFYTGGSDTPNERMRIDSSGNVGIGTTSPTTLFEVVGTSTFNGDAISDFTGNNLSVTNGTLNAASGSGSPGGSDGQVQFNSSGAFAGSSDFFWDESNSQLGIGTSSPTSTLDVDGSIHVSEHEGYQQDGETILTTATSSGRNLFVGVDAGINTQLGAPGYQGDQNTFMGFEAGKNNTEGENNLFIGNEAGINNTTGSFNAFLGSSAGIGNTGGIRNTYIGQYTAINSSGGSENIILGWSAGHTLVSGDNNILIGPEVDVPASSTANHLNIGDTIYGDLSANNIGVGTSTPTSALDVVGTTTADAISVNNDEITDFTGNNLSVTNGTLNASGGSGSPAGSDGQVQFNSSGSFAGSSDFFWDDTNTRLGLGTSSPNRQLHISSSSPVDAVSSNPETDVLIEDTNDTLMEFMSSQNNSNQAGILFSDNSEAAGYVNYLHGDNNGGDNELQLGAWHGISFQVEGATGRSKSERMRLTPEYLQLHNPSNSDEEFHIGPSDSGSSDTAIEMENSNNIFGLHAQDDNKFRITDGGENEDWFTLDGSNGNVGVGVNSPSSQFHVSGGNGKSVVTIEADENNSGEDNNPEVKMTQDGGNNQGVFGLNGSADSSFSGALPNAVYMEVDSTDPIQFASNGVDRMTIDGSGNLGIGTTSPTNLLDVEGAAAIGSDYSGSNSAPTDGLLVEGDVGIGTTSPVSALAVSGTTTADALSVGASTISNFTGNNLSVTSGTLNAASGSGSPGGSDGQVQFNSSGSFAGSSDFFWDNSNSQLGIGTSSPSYQLEVDTGSSNNDGIRLSGSSNPKMILEDTDGGWPGIRIDNNGTVRGKLEWHDTANAFTLANVDSGPIAFVTSDSSQNTGTTYEKMRLTRSGNLGLGTSNPTNTLDVVNATDTQPVASFKDDQFNDLMLLTNGGNLGIGTVSPSSALDVVGTTTADALSVGGDTISNFTGSNLSVTNGTLNAASGSGSPGGSDGQVQFNSSGSFAGSSDFFWDNTNSQLGIGTASPEFALDVAGTTTVRGEFNVSANNSSTSSPRTAAFSDLSSGEAVRFKFGDPYNAFQNQHGGSLDMYAYHTIRLAGNRGELSSLPYGTQSDVGVNVMSTGSGQMPLAITGASGQSGNLTEWQDDTGSALSVVDSSGNFGIGTSSPTAPLYIDHDGSDTDALKIDTTDSSLDGSPAFKIETPSTGNQKGFQIAKANDPYAWASFSNNDSNSPSQNPGFFLGGGSNARDVGLYRGGSDMLSLVGDIGIGISSPGSNLHIASTSPELRLQTTGADNYSRIIFDEGDFGSTDGYMTLRYNDTSNAMEFYDGVNDVIRMQVDRSGNVGIGTTSPVSALSVVGTTTADAISVNNDEITDFTGNNLSVDSSGALNAASGSGSPGGSDGQVQFNSSGSFAGSSDFFWDDTNSRLGIGTTTPDEPLHISGSNESDEVSLRLTNSAVDNPTQIAFEEGSQEENFALRYDGSSNLFKFMRGDASFGGELTHMVIERDDGNVGIGTESPSSLLDVSGAVTANSLSIGSDSISDFTGNNLSVTNGTLNASGGSGSPAGSDGQIQFNSSGSFGAVSDFFWDNTNNRLGIGDSSPTASLFVGANGADPRFRVESATSGTYALEVDENDETTVGTGDGHIFLDTSGGTNVGVGTSSPVSALAVSGTITQTNATGCTLRANASGNVICDTSDRDLKTDFGSIENPLQRLNEIDGQTYRFKDSSQFGSGERIGFVAQDVEGVFPQLVRDTGGYKTLDYGNMTAVLAEAVKELDTKVASSDTQSTATTTEVSDENILNTLQNYGVAITDGVAEFVKGVFESVTTSRLVIDSTSEETDPTASSSQIAKGKKGIEIENEHVSTSSQVHVTFTSEVKSGHWIEKGDGEFSVNLSATTTATTTFDYWVVGVEDEGGQDTQVDSGDNSSSSPDLGPMVEMEDDETSDDSADSTSTSTDNEDSTENSDVAGTTTASSTQTEGRDDTTSTTTDNDAQDSGDSNDSGDSEDDTSDTDESNDDTTDTDSTGDGNEATSSEDGSTQDSGTASSTTDDGPLDEEGTDSQEGAATSSES